jgi:DNA-binding NtrC family response regulator
MMTSVLEPEVKSDGTILGHVRPRIQCVFLTMSDSEFRGAAQIVKGARVSLYHAATLEQAEFQLSRTKAGVLLTELKLPDGDWEDALEMLANWFPRVRLVLAAANADENLWLTALERGAFDLVTKPFHATELRRALEKADAYFRASRQGVGSSSPLSGSSG